MTQKTTYAMKLRRRKEGKTDYRKRLALLKSRKPRLIARVKSRQVIAQIADYDVKGDIVKASATSLEKVTSPIAPSRDSTVRRYTSILSELFSMAEANC